MEVELKVEIGFELEVGVHVKLVVSSSGDCRR